jgi:NAD(P) transhydrogenase
MRFLCDAAIPEISMVGQTEHELTKNNIPYEYGVARYSEIAKGMMIGDETGGMLKILFHQETRKVRTLTRTPYDM